MGGTYLTITYVSKENNLGLGEKIRHIWSLKGPILILYSAAGLLQFLSIPNVMK